MAPRGTVEFRILGPLDVVSDGSPLALGPGKERALLAVLLLHRNERVSTDRLVDLLWEESPPESAPKMIQIYVSRLRRALAGVGGADRLVTQASGYRLSVTREELDLDRFERLFGEGREALARGEAAVAAERLREALSVWRGPPLGESGEGHFFEQERARLEELRLGAIEERTEAELAVGGGPALLAELQALVREHPLRERPAAQLMLALYRSGRQADALAVYKLTRDRLVGELGIEPGRPLKEVEQAILRQDPALDPPTDARTPAPAMPPRRQPPEHLARRTIALAAIVALAVAAVAAVTLVLVLGGGGQRQVQLAAEAVGVVRGGRLVEEARIGAAPVAIAAGDAGVWVATADDNSVSRLDEKTFHVRQTLPVGNGPSGIAFARDDVWVANGLDGTVSRIDSGANRVVQTISVGNGPAAIAYGLGSLWVANRTDQTVDRLDPRTGNVLDTLAAGTDAAGVAAGSGAVWVVDQARGRIVRLEPGFTEPVLRINVGNGPSAIALGAGSVWVANTLDSTVSRIDPHSNRVVATVPVGAGPGGIAFTPEGVWTANAFDDTLSRIDPRTSRVDRTIHLGQRPTAAAASDGSLLVTVGGSPASHRGGTLTVLQSEFDSIDPGRAFTEESWAALSLTNDGLATFRRVGGVQGTQVVADLAVDLPAPTDGGRTYTYRLRRGIRYSDGRLVRPEDFRRAIERTIVAARNPFYYAAISGSADCAARPARCDLSRGIVADDRAWTVTFHLRVPDPDFLYKLALPLADAVPAATPAADIGTHPIPATGPYLIQSYIPGRLVRLVRNPRFRPWSENAQPPGYAAKLVLRLGVAPTAQVRAVERGEADVAFDGVPPRLLREAETQYASHLHENALSRTTYMFLNTRVRPFDDVRVRRAVNYAVDRASVVRALGGLGRAQPTCQFLPPGIAGYRPYCPFTLNPSRSGLWGGPDLVRARRLIAASGTKGAHVTVWIPQNRAAEGAFAVGLLRALGFQARAKHLGRDYYVKVGDSRLNVQAGVQSWGADYPAPWDFFFLLSCRTFVRNSGQNPNVSEFCDRKIDRQMTRARALELSDPALASSLWSRIDHELVDQAPVVPLANPKQVDFVSGRVGNYQFNPQWLVLLDRLWVR